jgi:hypothetical protein
VPRKPGQVAVLAEPAAPVRAASRAGASTLTSIAAEAGVSVSTVSKVLNGRTDVAPATRERIGLLLRRHGYQPGAKLGFGVVDLLLGAGVPLPGTAERSPWAEELIHGAAEAAAEAGYSVVVNAVNSASEFDRWLELATVRGTYGALSILHLPGRGTGPGHLVGRHHQLARRPYRHPSSHRTGPSPHRRHRRVGRPVVQPGPA